MKSSTAPSHPISKRHGDIKRQPANFYHSHKRPRGAPRMTYGRSVIKALDTFDLDHKKWPELAADRLAWRAMLHSGQPPPAYRAPPPTPAALPIALTRPKRSTLAATNAAIHSARLDFSIHPCAPLCTHAYAIRRQDAVGFYSNIRSHLERVGRFKQNFYGYGYYRYNIDVNLRGYFQTNRALAPLQWPTCIRMSGQGFTGLTSLIIQNASMPKVVGWHGAGPL